MKNISTSWQLLSKNIQSQIYTNGKKQISQQEIYSYILYAIAEKIGGNKEKDENTNIRQSWN